MKFKKLEKEVGFGLAFKTVFGKTKPDSWPELTLGQLLEIYAVIEEVEKKKIILKKILSTEVTGFYKLVEAVRKVYRIPEGEDRDIVLKIMTKKMLEAASTFPQYDLVLGHTLKRSEEEKMALKKMLETASTFQEYNLVLKDIPEGSKERDIILGKMLKTAITFKQMVETYKLAPEGSGLQKNALGKMRKMEAPLEDYIKVYEKERYHNSKKTELSQLVLDKISKMKLNLKESRSLIYPYFENPLIKIGSKKIMEADSSIGECLKAYKKAFSKKLWTEVEAMEKKILAFNLPFRKWLKTHKKFIKKYDRALENNLLEKLLETAKSKRQLFKILKLTYQGSDIQKTVLERLAI